MNLHPASGCNRRLPRAFCLYILRTFWHNAEGYFQVKNEDNFHSDFFQIQSRKTIAYAYMSTVPKEGLKISRLPKKKNVEKIEK